MNHKRRRITLAVIILFLGGSGLVYEYCLSTLATHLVGNSVEQFSVIIALMLFAMGLAGIAQRGLSDLKRVTETFIIVEAILGLIGGASAILLYLSFAWLDHFRLVLYGLAVLIGFGIGLEIPLLLRLNEDWQKELRHNIGEVLSLDYIGALAGALIWAFVLLPRFSLDRISLFLGLANLGVAGLTLTVFWKQLERRGPAIGVILGAITALIALTAVAPRLVDDARQHLYADPVVLHRTSVYQDIVITASPNRFSMYLNGHLQFDSEDEFIYHEMLVHPALAALQPAPKRVLVLGGGDGLAIREILRWPTVETVVLVDLDPAVTQIARTWPPLVALNNRALADARIETRLAKGITPGPKQPVIKTAENPRDALHNHREVIADVHLLHLDADQFLATSPGPWDAIICDFPDPSAPELARLFSLEFFQQARRALRPGGILVVQSGSPYTTRRAFWTIHDTIQAAGMSPIPYHTHVPTFGEWGWVVAGRDKMPRSTTKLPDDLRYLTTEVLAASMVFPPPMARPVGESRVSTRLDPRVMQLYLAGEPLGVGSSH